MSHVNTFTDLPALAKHLRDELATKKYALLYAYNGTGKTRLSGAFSELGKQRDDEGLTVARDTLYFNAFTEDLFSWDNDLDNDELRVLELNAKSRFFAGLGDFEIENRIRTLLNRYADFGISIELKYREATADEDKPMLEEGWVTFSREILIGNGQDERLETIENIKISRGEESIFIWCFFLAIVEVTLDPKLDAYDWVRYIYIDDPISSLDEQNAVHVATHLAKMLKDAHQTATETAQDRDPPAVIISTHHPLFHNVLWNELKKASRRYFLARDASTGGYAIRNTEATPFFHHLAALIELYDRHRAGEIDSYHFNTLRAIAEKTASFLGYNNFGDCIKREADDLDGVLHTRLLNLLSHGGWSIYEPTQLGDDNKEKFGTMLHNFIRQYAFNSEFFPDLFDDTETPATETEEAETP